MSQRKEAYANLKKKVYNTKLPQKGDFYSPSEVREVLGRIEFIEREDKNSLDKQFFVRSLVQHYSYALTLDLTKDVYAQLMEKIAEVREVEPHTLGKFVQTQSRNYEFACPDYIIQPITKAVMFHSSNFKTKESVGVKIANYDIIFGGNTAIRLDNRTESLICRPVE